MYTYICICTYTFVMYVVYLHTHTSMHTHIQHKHRLTYMKIERAFSSPCLNPKPYTLKHTLCVPNSSKSSTTCTLVVTHSS